LHCGWRLWCVCLGHNGDGLCSVRRTQVRSTCGSTVFLLARNVEVTVGGPHVGVWDRRDAIVEHRLCGSRLDHRLLAPQVDVVAASLRVLGDDCRLEADLDAGGLAREVTWVEDQSANPNRSVGSVDGFPRSVAFLASKRIVVTKAHDRTNKCARMRRAWDKTETTIGFPETICVPSEVAKKSAAAQLVAGQYSCCASAVTMQIQLCKSVVLR
jgi:hypothetical protein